MVAWRFFCYDDGEELDIWRRWFRCERKVTDKIRARHRVVLDRLRVTEFWRTEPDLVHGLPLDGVVELVVMVKRDLQWRIVGTYGGGQNVFTILGFVYHKGDKYYPKGEMAKIERRRDELKKGGFQKRRPCEPPTITERIEFPDE